MEEDKAASYDLTDYYGSLIGYRGVLTLFPFVKGVKWRQRNSDTTGIDLQAGGRTV